MTWVVESSREAAARIFKDAASRLRALDFSVAYSFRYGDDSDPEAVSEASIDPEWSAPKASVSDRERTLTLRAATWACTSHDSGRYSMPEQMTTYELAKRLLEFPPDTPVVHAFDWTPVTEVGDYTTALEGPKVCV